MISKEFLEEFNIKENIEIPGITADHVWYETDRMLNDMSNWQSRFKRLSSVMEARHKEHLKIIDDLLAENRKLKEQLKEKQ